MASKRDKKALFPFIKPKGSIKKDIQELRRSSQSGAEEGDGGAQDIHQPVQRRESARLSSASKLFKHLKPERHHPAYSSEGKGLRKRRQPWASERELNVASRARADDGHGTLKTLSNKDRSRSFNEQDRMVHTSPSGPADKENEAGFGNDKEPPKWRFRLRNSAAATVPSAASPEPLYTAKTASLVVSQPRPASPEPVPNPAASQHRKSHSFSSPGHAKSNEPRTILPDKTDDTLKESIYANVIETKPLPKEELPCAEPIYTNAVQLSNSNTDIEPDYANIEQLQISKEPDLLQNLPNLHHHMPQLHSAASPSSASSPSRRSSQPNSEGDSKMSGRGRHALALPLNRSVSMSLTSTTTANRDIEVDSAPPASVGPGLGLSTNSFGLERQRGHARLQPLLNAKSTPSLTRDVGNEHALSPSADPGLLVCKSALDYPPKLSTAQSTPNLDVARSPISPKSLDLLPAEMHSPQHNSMESHATWDWERPPPPGDMYTEDEYQYASQLRSSMASVLHGRQSSSLSAGSSASHSRQPSALSTHSDDTFVGQSMYGEDIGLPSPRARFSSDSSQNTYDTFRQDMTLYYKQYSGGGGGKGGMGGPNGNTWVPMVLEPDQFTLCNKASSSPPPPPPVRDASSLKYIKYGPGHEKHPSWPMPAAATQSLQVLTSNSSNPPSHADDESNSGGIQQSGQSQRSKSWTEQTDYPKEPPASYVRPYVKPRSNASFSQQLKTVMENCVERIPPEAYQPKEYASSAFYPTFDCDGRPLSDQDYNAPSPPERDMPSYMSTYSGPSSDYAKYEDMQQYSHSEGYSSYVPSEASYVSVASSGTPLLDRLRREGEIGPGPDPLQARDTTVPVLHHHPHANASSTNTTNNGRESVTTVATNSSGSNSSNETLRWHGSYSDISVMSGSSRGVDSRGSLEPGASLVVVHSAKVQAPVRHNSESVLYYSTGSSSPDGSQMSEHGSVKNCKETAATRIWTSQERKLNEYNHHQQRKPQAPPKLVYQRSCSSNNAFSEHGQRSPTVDTSHQLSVAERIHQLERQSKSVPNLFDKAVFQRPPPPNLHHYHSAGEATSSFHSSHSQPSVNKVMMSAIVPSVTRYPQPQTLKLSPTGPAPVEPDAALHSLLNRMHASDASSDGAETSSNHHTSNPTTTPYVNYTYLDPDKRLRVADPTLKAIQKQALLSYYERHTTGKGGAHQQTDNRGNHRDMAPFHQASSGIARLARVPEPLSLTMTTTTALSASSRQSSPTKTPLDRQLADSVSPKSLYPEPLPPRKNKNDVPELAGGPYDRIQPSSESSTNGGGFGPDAENMNSPVTRKGSFHNNSDVIGAPLPPRDHTLNLVPPERPPKKPHLRAQPPPPISAEQELRRIEASVQELMNLSPARRTSTSSSTPATATGQVPLRKKPPAPDPPATEGTDQYNITHASTLPSLPALPSQSQYWATVSMNADTGTALSSSPSTIAAGASSPETSASFTPPFRHTSSASPTQRSLSPELPLPPPPLLLNASAILMDVSEDDPLPPPPSPLDVTLTMPTSAANLTYHKESYMVHCKSASAQRLLNASPSNIETSVSPGGWERQHNIRSTGTTLVFSSDELKGVENPETNEQEASATKLNNLPTLQHTYRSVPYVNADRFAYLRKVSNGEGLSKPRSPESDPISSSSTIELENNINKALSSTNLSTNERLNSNPSEETSTVISTVHLTVADLDKKKEDTSQQLTIPSSQPLLSNGCDTLVANTNRGSIRRTKKPEEIECEQLSLELANHLSPSDKLRALLAGPSPHHLTPAHYVEELFSVRLASPSLPAQRLDDSSDHSLPTRTILCAPLPANSSYFTTSEPMAKMMNRYGQDMNEQQGTVVDTQALAKKKEELMARLGRKLEVLRSEKLMVHEEVEANEALGAAVAARVAAVATPLEANKVALHVAEVDKITALLLALAGRLARAQNALQCLPAQADPQEKATLESKRDKLAEQLDEAKLLNENIEKRSRQVALLLSKYFSNEEFADYDHFVTMKAKLVMDSREIDDKIKLGEEQLAALKETMVIKRS